MVTYLEILKKNYRSIIYTQNAIIWCKNCKNRAWFVLFLLHKIGYHGNVPWGIGKNVALVLNDVLCFVKKISSVLHWLCSCEVLLLSFTQLIRCQKPRYVCWVTLIPCNWQENCHIFISPLFNHLVVFARWRQQCENRWTGRIEKGRRHRVKGKWWRRRKGRRGGGRTENIGPTIWPYL